MPCCTCPGHGPQNASRHINTPDIPHNLRASVCSWPTQEPQWSSLVHGWFLAWWAKPSQTSTLQRTPNGKK
eukprot:12102038-Alexandrium_andersonii.AAC.1